ncbi:MAG: lipoyl synthase, partial [Hymenobacter sp.]
MLLSLPIIQPQPEVVAPARPRKPDWLRVKLPIGPDYAAVRKLVDEHK